MVAQHPHPTTTDGGSTGFAGAKKPAMRVMVVDRCPQLISLTVNGTAVFLLLTYKLPTLTPDKVK